MIVKMYKEICLNMKLCMTKNLVNVLTSLLKNPCNSKFT